MRAFLPLLVLLASGCDLLAYEPLGHPPAEEPPECHEQESDAAICTRLSRTCGGVTAPDLCGTPRTVTCGDPCPAWPMFRGDPAHQGRSPTVAAQTATVKWKYPVGETMASPALGADGTVYIPSFEGKLSAVKPDGTLAWAVSLKDGSRSSPAVGPDGTVYVGCDDGCVYTFAADGSPSLSFCTDDKIYTAPLIAGGALFVASEDFSLYGVEPAGMSMRWKFPTHGTFTSPARGPDGKVYLGSGFRLFAINPDEGTQAWVFELQNFVGSSPAIGDDGTVYVGSDDTNLYAVRASDGTRRWAFATGGQVQSSPAIGADGTIFVGSEDRKLYAVHPDGTLRWSFATGGVLHSSPAVGGDGTVYIGSRDKRIYAVGPDGVQKWSYLTGQAVESSPAIGADGTVYVASEDGFLYAFGP